jgi:hypothetical protein
MHANQCKEKSTKEDHLEDLSAKNKIILQRLLNIIIGACGPDSPGSEHCEVNLDNMDTVINLWAP